MGGSQGQRIAWVVLAGIFIGCPNEDQEQLETVGTTGISVATGLATTGASAGVTTSALTSAAADLTGVGGSAEAGAVGHDSGVETQAAATGAGDEASEQGTGPTSDCDGLRATLRDFSDAHPDFQAYLGTSDGLVAAALGDDDKPRLNPDYSGQTLITSEESFSDWYNDIDGVNQAFEIELPLVEENPGEFTFDDPQFFPLDDLGFGNEGRGHNFHFTTEVHTSFTYGGGEVFTFRGDDDVWLFVDGQLVLDLGGVHGPLEETLEMDNLGLTVGQTVPMDIFHAERHTSQSNFRMTTSIECFITPVPQ